MLSRDLRFSGFSARSWQHLVSLFDPSEGPAGEHVAAQDELAKHGTVVVTEAADGSACAAFHTDRGSIDTGSYTSRADLPQLCERQLALRGVVVRRGAIEELTERAALRVLAEDDYVSQWLALLAVARELERDGLLHFWPSRAAIPLPSSAVVARTLDVVLPDEHSFLAVVWEGSEIWTALLLRRRGGDIDLIAGPELVSDVTGPLGGDYRRDHRTLSQAVSRAIAPVHIGLFAERERLTQLLRDPRPGAWAKAIAVRDVIIDPAPAYVHVAAGADALRAAAASTSQWLGGLDILAPFEPLARIVREQVVHVASVTNLLGWNPLQTLAGRLRK